MAQDYSRVQPRASEGGRMCGWVTEHGAGGFGKKIGAN